eukprot:4397054-Karenia_brevis.AAC.1
MARWVVYISSAKDLFLRTVSKGVLLFSAISNSIPKHIDAIRVDDWDAHQCDVCSRTFASLQQLNLHKFRSHGHINPVHLLVEGPHCPVCLQFFGARVRLLEHLKYKGKKRR